MHMDAKVKSQEKQIAKESIENLRQKLAFTNVLSTPTLLEQNGKAPTKSEKPLKAKWTPTPHEMEK